MLRRFVIGVGVLLGTGCADAGGVASLEPTVRDSAGVRIVEHPASVLDQPSLELGAPAVEIGAMDGEGADVFSGVIGVVRLDDGAIAVLDRQAAEVRVFEPTGDLRARFGREGQGPGEFEWPEELVRFRGDTLAVVDRFGYRAHRFLSDGTLLDFEERSMTDSLSWSLVDVFADGAWFVHSWEPRYVPPDGRWDRWQAAGRTARASGTVDSLASHRGSLTFIRHSAQGVSSIAIPLAPEGASVPLGDGVVAHDGDRYALRWHGPRGALRQVVRLQLEPPELTDVDLDAEREHWIARSRGNERAGVERLFLELPRQPRLPAFGEMVGDRRDILWVAVKPPPVRPDEPQPEVRWLVVRADGSIAGAVDLAPAEQPRFLDATHLVTVWRDELDVERVRVYPLPPALTDVPGA